MTHKLRRRKIDSTTEKRILTAMIVSTQFLQEIRHLIVFDYFENLYIKRVVEWCTEHYDKYDIAPFDDITSIFHERKIELKKEDAELVEKLLKDISNKYAVNQNINVPYIVDQTLLFFKKRELEITKNNITYHLNKNDIDGAEDQVNQFAKISRVTSGWIDPLDEKYIDEVFESENRMFNFPGALGTYLNGFERGWLVTVAGGYKRGKSFSLQEIVVHAIQQRLRVVFFSLEMGRRESNDRFYKRILGAGTKEGGEALYPTFDCEYNQNGSCKKPERVNTIPLLKDDIKPIFHRNMEYRPCTYCRDNKLGGYKVAWWYELLSRPQYCSELVKKQTAAFKKVWPNMYRFKQYAKFSATLDDMRRDLDILEKTDDFVPDIIIIDQANCVKPEQGISLDGTAPHTAVWRGMAALAGERHALVVSPTQITRAALDKKMRNKEILHYILDYLVMLTLRIY